MKRLLAMTVATVIATSGCSYLNRCGYGDYGGYDGCCDSYGDGAIYDEGGFQDGAEYPVYMPGNGGFIGPDMIVPGETIPAPAGELLPGPAP
jgi:hypothetical protein